MGRLIDLFYNRYNYTDFHELNLSWLLESVKELLIAMDNMEEWKTQHIDEYEQLKKLYDDIVSGNFPPSMLESLKIWVQRNAVDLIGDMVKMVFFELTDDGYFVAHVPESWSDIRFGTTGLDIIKPGYDYGHLVLSY